MPPGFGVPGLLVSVQQTLLSRSKPVAEVCQQDYRQARAAASASATPGFTGKPGFTRKPSQPLSTDFPTLTQACRIAWQWYTLCCPSAKACAWLWRNDCDLKRAEGTEGQVHRGQSQQEQPVTSLGGFWAKGLGARRQALDRAGALPSLGVLSCCLLHPLQRCEAPARLSIEAHLWPSFPGCLNLYRASPLEYYQAIKGHLKSEKLQVPSCTRVPPKGVLLPHSSPVLAHSPIYSQPASFPPQLQP